VKLTPLALRLSEDFRGLQQPLLLLHHPEAQGDLVSRPAAEVLRRPRSSCKAGVKELLVISQDTSAYGLDIKYQPSLWQDREVRTRFFDLARELGDSGCGCGMHYVYPYPHVDEVIPLMAEGQDPPYLDIPFQHASPNVLKAMRRPAHQEKTLERIRPWREICPGPRHPLHLHRRLPGRDGGRRGFLLDWLKEAKLDRVGLLPLRARARARRRTRSATRPAGGQGRALAPLHEDAARGERQAQKAKVGKRLSVIIDEPGTGGEGAVEVRRAGDRRGRLRVLAPPLAGGRHRHGEGEPGEAYDLHGAAV
jgi:ribosomal protein S12 methylthiotransferase